MQSVIRIIAFVGLGLTGCGQEHSGRGHIFLTEPSATGTGVDSSRDLGVSDEDRSDFADRCQRAVVNACDLLPGASVVRIHCQWSENSGYENYLRSKTEEASEQEKSCSRTGS